MVKTDVLNIMSNIKAALSKSRYMWNEKRSPVNNTSESKQILLENFPNAGLFIKKIQHLKFKISIV